MLGQVEAVIDIVYVLENNDNHAASYAGPGEYTYEFLLVGVVGRCLAV